MGIGRQLTLALVNGMLQQGLHSMLVWVLVDNPSRGFYEALGGQPLGEADVEIGGAGLREVAYGWADLAQLAGILQT
jgi:hypothetical protein